MLLQPRRRLRPLQLRGHVFGNARISAFFGMFHFGSVGKYQTVVQAASESHDTTIVSTDLHDTFSLVRGIRAGNGRAPRSRPRTHSRGRAPRAPCRPCARSRGWAPWNRLQTHSRGCQCHQAGGRLDDEEEGAMRHTERHVIWSRVKSAFQSGERVRQLVVRGDRSGVVSTTRRAAPSTARRMPTSGPATTSV